MGAYKHWWTRQIHTNFVYGLAAVDGSAGRDPEDFRRTRYLAGNLIWSPIAPMDAGIEFLWGSFENKAREKGIARRIQFSLKHNFDWQRE